MDQDPFRYDKWIEEALRSVVKRALDQMQDSGLWGNHHFYITFQTDHPGVSMPDRLLAQYPEEITIVLQYEFWDLMVGEEHFEVTLSFDNLRSKLSVPYTAISAFADPVVKFALQLKMDSAQDDEEFLEDLDLGPGVDEPVSKPHFDNEEAEDDAEPEEEKMGEVIALDAFRKK